MAHKNKNAEIHKIEIARAENGFTYRVCVDMEGDGQPSMDWYDYVYESVEDVLAAVKDDLESPHAREYPNKERMQEAFHEVKENEPETVEKTRKKYGKEKARKQFVAIALSKARGGLFKK